MIVPFIGLKVVMRNTEPWRTSRLPVVSTIVALLAWLAGCADGAEDWVTGDWAVTDEARLETGEVLRATSWLHLRVDHVARIGLELDGMPERVVSIGHWQLLGDDDQLELTLNGGSERYRRHVVMAVDELAVTESDGSVTRFHRVFRWPR